MKKAVLVLVFFFCLFLLFSKKETTKEEMKSEEKKAIFFSYIELQKYIKNKSIDDGKKNIEQIINQLEEYQFNMLILQVRSFSDAIYESSLFPWSSTVSKSEGESPGYDVLDYFIQCAHQKGIEVHAWINPYRIRNHSDTSTISTQNKAYSLLNTNHVKISDNGIFYNPASEEVKELIVDGVEEISKKYSIDGVCFDDYFYPDSEIDIENYQEYQKSHDISLEEYHLMQVNDLVKRVHEVTEKYHIAFGISPEGNISNNYTKNFADVYTWGKSDLYVDYLMPQIYYGFYNEAQPFYQVLSEWNQLVEDSKVGLIPALAFYKIDTQDNYAKGGINEWIEEDDIIMRQVLLSRNVSSYQGFSIFRYDSMFQENQSTTTLKEVKNLKKVIVS